MEAGSTATLTPDVSSILGSPDLANKLDAKEGLSDLPPAPTTTALATQATSMAAAGSPPQQLDCRSMLADAQRTQVENYAKGVFPKLAEDPNQLDAFGSEAVDEINGLVKQMLDEAGREADIPQIVSITHDLDDRMRQFNRRHGTQTVQQNTSAYDKTMDKAWDIVHKMGDWLHDLLRDAQGLQAYLDKLTADLEDKRGELRHNVAMCNQLYAANETAITNLVVTIAAMEYVLDDAQAAATAIVVDDSAPDARAKREQRDTLTQEFIPALQNRIGEFKQRLFVAWATAPQIRNIRMVSFGLGQRLALLITLTIPVFELTVVEWVTVQQAAKASEAQEAVTDATNTAMQGFAAATAEAIPQIAKTIQTPSMSPETITLVAQSISDQLKGITDAVQYGMQARQGVDNAIMTAQSLLASASDQESGKILQLVTQSEQTPAQAPLPQLPQAVVDQAPQLLSS
jgi:uncharacterized protein YaaN involved in tellurite resistance